MNVIAGMRLPIAAAKVTDVLLTLAKYKFCASVHLKIGHTIKKRKI